LRIRRRRGLALALFTALALASPAGAESSGRTPLLDQIRTYRGLTWHWQRLMGRPLTEAGYREREVESRPYRAWLRDVWKMRAKRASRRAHRPPHLSTWRCLHRYEGAWSDPDAPYWGGLQMDFAFQRTYGRRLLRTKGTANHWTPLEQMWTAERALRAGRGFYPWPVSAHRCGLL
jgi:hypothetical protein